MSGIAVAVALLLRHVWLGGRRALLPGSGEGCANPVASLWPACRAYWRLRACCLARLQVLRVEHPEDAIRIGDQDENGRGRLQLAKGAHIGSVGNEPAPCLI